MSSEREYEFDILRILALLTVMCTHISAQNWYVTKPGSFEWEVFNLGDSISRWAVPVFLMISGRFFLDKEVTIREIYGKYIFRIVKAFLFWSIIYAGMFQLCGNSMKHFALAVVSGPWNFWFLFMICGFYMIVPFLKKISENERLLKYYMFLSFIFTFLIPQMIGIINLFSEKLSGHAQEIMDKFHMNFVVGYSFYFVLGYFISKYKMIGRKFVYLCIVGIGSFVFTDVATSALSRYTGEPNSFFYGNLTINVCLESVFVFIVVIRLFRNHLFEKRKKTILLLSKYSFGAYLVHGMIIEIFEICGFTTMSINPLIAVIVLLFLVALFSWGIAIILGKIPIINRIAV